MTLLLPMLLLPDAAAADAADAAAMRGPASLRIIPVH
jgi:hypothetical protein